MPRLQSIYIPSCYSSKVIANTRRVRIQGDISLPSPSVLYVFIGEYTEEGVPRSLTLSLLSPLTNAGITVVVFLQPPPQGFGKTYLDKIIDDHCWYHNIREFWRGSDDHCKSCHYLLQCTNELEQLTLKTTNFPTLNTHCSLLIR